MATLHCLGTPHIARSGLSPGPPPHVSPFGLPELAINAGR